MKLSVAACQILSHSEPDKSADKVLGWMEQAAAQGVDVISFPEACLCGYSCTPEYWAAAKPEDFARAEGRVIAKSRELDLAVILGTAHWEGKSVYNSLLVIDKGGVVRGRYAKTHLAEDWSAPGHALPTYQKVRGRYAKTHLAEDWSAPGHALPTYQIAGVESCFLVCHDIRYPELVRLPAIAGARICYFCSSESGLTQEHKLSAYRAMPISRACENTVYLVMANMPADPHDILGKSQSHGNSKIIDPQGNVLDEAGYFEERLVTAVVDVEAATRAMAMRAVTDSTILRDWMVEGVRLVERHSA